MILYRYFSPQRIDVIQKLKIRFTQPAVYNDPFELRSIPSHKITQDIFTNILPILVEHYDRSESKKAQIRAITYTDFLADSSLILDLIQECMASGFLSLSLTEIPDNLLMWAHYACNHKGFVIGFDMQHEFFRCPNETYYPVPIRYQPQRPAITFPNPNGLDAYFTKSVDWAYEKEWRIFKKLPIGVLPEQSVCLDAEGFPVYLFDLPAESIKEIIIGCRMDLIDQQVIKKVIDPKFSHVRILQAKLSSTEYKIVLSKAVK